MEFCGGKTLKDLIDKGLYKKEDKVWCLLREILQGLNHIHEQGMIHRDLKPGNVLIDTLGHAKIGDFGLATTKLIIKNEGLTNDVSIVVENSVNSFNSLRNSQAHSSNATTANDSAQASQLSGAVGTALYVAPELMTPSTKNKFIYTQVSVILLFL